MTRELLKSLFSAERENWDDLDSKTMNFLIVVNVFAMFATAFICIVLPVLFVYANVQLAVEGYSALMQNAMYVGAVGVLVDAILVVAAGICLLRRR